MFSVHAPCPVSKAFSIIDFNIKSNSDKREEVAILNPNPTSLLLVAQKPT